MKLNKKEYERLLAKKAKQRLSNEEFALFKELQAKFGDGNHNGNNSQSKENGFGPGNDFAWWNKYAELLDNAVNIKSNYIPGYPIDPIHLNFNLSSVIRLQYVPTYGRSVNSTDPVNVWARDLFLRMFQKWRGISAYTAADLGIVLIAGIEVVRMITKLERIYGVVNRYSKLNLNMPYTEVQALGLTQAQADYIRGHLSDYRYDLYVLLQRAQRLCIPKDISLLADQISLLNYEYLDHDNAKAQIIIFDSYYFGVFSDTDLSTGSSVKITNFTNNTPTPIIDFSGTADNMFPALELMINALIGSDGVQRIYGDLITWFGESQMLQFVALPADYVIAPVKNDTILHKFHNIDPVSITRLGYLKSFIRTALPAADATVIKALQTNTHEYYIYQANDSICTRVTRATSNGTPGWFSVSGGEMLLDNYSYSDVQTTILDTYRVEVNPEVVTEGMLFKYAGVHVGAQAGGIYYYGMDLLAYGFEIVTSIHVYTLDISGNVSSLSVETLNVTTATAASAAGTLALWDWAPLSYLFNTSGSGQGPAIDYAYGDMDTLIPVNVNVKSKALTAIVFSGLKTEIKALDKMNN